VQFPKEARAIVLSLAPPFSDGREIRITPLAPLATKLSFLIGNPSRDPPTNGSFSHPETPCNLFGREALFPQFEHVVRPIRSLRMVGQVSTACTGIGLKRPIWTCWLRFVLFLFLVMWAGSLWRLRCLADLSTAAGENLFHNLRHVLRQMKAVGDLFRLGRSESGGGCGIFSSISADDREFRVHAHPGGCRLGVSIGDYEGYPLVILNISKESSG
jgi:hypothetical protein